ncbi:MAG TPA: ABC transporter permease [Gemmatimonadales bacterium]
MFSWWPTALERRIALRYLRGQRGTRNASLQTVISIGSITLGVSALIVVLGVMNGLRNDLRDRILVGSPELRVLTFGTTLQIADWQAQLARIRRDPDVVAAAPEVDAQSLVMNSAGFPEGVFVAGLEPGVGTRQVIHLDSAMTEGDLNFKATLPKDSVDGAVVIGKRLADHLSAYPGDIISMIPPVTHRNRITGEFDVPRSWSMEVTGVFETGMYIYDNSYVVMDRATAQRFVGLDTAVSAIGVRVRDPWRVATVGDRLTAALGYPFRVETWQSQNSTLFSALQLEKLAMGLVIFFIMIVAAFNIVGTLTMVVAFKTREIGILEAMGLPARGVARVFLAQGAVVGLVGTGLGLVLGLAVAFLVDKRIHIDPTIYFIDRLPVRVEITDVLVVVVASIAVAVLATIPSSRRAASLLPVEAIRAE